MNDQQPKRHEAGAEPNQGSAPKKHLALKASTLAVTRACWDRIKEHKALWVLIGIFYSVFASIIYAARFGPFWILTAIWLVAGVLVLPTAYRYCSHRPSTDSAPMPIVAAVPTSTSVEVRTNQPLSDALAPTSKETAVPSTRTFVIRRTTATVFIGNGYRFLFPNTDCPAQPSISDGMPLNFHVRGGHLFVTANIWDGCEGAKLEERTLIDPPLGWDINFDDRAFEVVNAWQRPIFQAIWRDDLTMAVRGIFRLNGTPMLANVSYTGPLESPPIGVPIALGRQAHRLFRYPSSSFQGIKDDSDDSAPTAATKPD